MKNYNKAKLKNTTFNKQIYSITDKHNINISNKESLMVKDSSSKFNNKFDSNLSRENIRTSVNDINIHLDMYNEYDKFKIPKIIKSKAEPNIEKNNYEIIRYNKNSLLKSNIDNINKNDYLLNNDINSINNNSDVISLNSNIRIISYINQISFKMLKTPNYELVFSLYKEVRNNSHIIQFFVTQEYLEKFDLYYIYLLFDGIIGKMREYIKKMSHFFTSFDAIDGLTYLKNHGILILSYPKINSLYDIKLIKDDSFDDSYKNDFAFNMKVNELLDNYRNSINSKNINIDHHISLLKSIRSDLIKRSYRKDNIIDTKYIKNNFLYNNVKYVKSEVFLDVEVYDYNEFDIVQEYHSNNIINDQKNNEDNEFVILNKKYSSKYELFMDIEVNQYNENENKIISSFDSQNIFDNKKNFNLIQLYNAKIKLNENLLEDNNNNDDDLHVNNEVLKRFDNFDINIHKNINLSTIVNNNLYNYNKINVNSPIDHLNKKENLNENYIIDDKDNVKKQILSKYQIYKLNGISVHPDNDI